LRDGEPCPVCGSAEHPFHQPEACCRAWAATTRPKRTAQKQVEQLNTKLVELRTELGVVNAQLKDYQQQQLNWANSCSRCSIRFRPSPVAGARPAGRQGP
jgi:exonuclease SbcC